MTVRTHPTADVAEQMGCSERWVLEQLRANRFPGRKIGRHWRMTDQDIEDALDICRNELRVAQPDVLPLVGLTPRSKQRLSNLARLEGGDDDAA